MKQITHSVNYLSNTNQEIKLSIARERLRQARYSFNLALVATTVSSFIGLAGAGLLLSGKSSIGAATSTTGVVASIGCIQLAKDTNNRLDKILAELQQFSGK